MMKFIEFQAYNDDGKIIKTSIRPEDVYQVIDPGEIDGVSARRTVSSVVNGVTSLIVVADEYQDIMERLAKS